MFLAQERNPPRFGDIPETTSTVLWIQDLLSKITHPMDKIMDSKDLSHNEMEIHERFKKTELLLRSYQQRKYESWKISAAEKLNKFLHSNVLRKLHCEPDTLKGRKKYEEVLLYQINFPLYFEELSVEAKFLENYGYDIPNFIRNVILQERTFYQYRSKLKNILEDLKHSVAELEDEELSVMAVPTSDLINLLEPGINICWESTEILEFLKNIERGVDVFRGVVSQVKKIITEINSRIKLLSTCDLLQFESVLDKIPTCEFMLDNLEYLEEEILEHFIFPYITAAYQSEDELIRSSFIGIKLVFVIFFQSLTESTRKLLRWFDGSCISTSPFYSQRFKQNLEFSYYLDLSIHPGIKKISLRILQKVFCFVDNIE
ncbi:dynein axonemal heavy chain 10 isoform X2 [Parasteatoda tepidariorum]|uniref:dynein axonemal heavy chain 10 isoform X2 n=1 Tax=Parasteatoda tepidariorum TaxID=114398 RepID=UPI0039BD4856